MPQINTLLVGLGGTGCAVVRELKKKLYIEWRSRGNTGDYPAIYEFTEEFGGDQVKSRIATLSVDSNLADLEGQGEKLRAWRVFGETIRLQDDEKVLLNPSGFNDIIKNLSRYPSIEPWIGNEIDFVRDFTRGTSGSAGCNQIRRMGRLALANGGAINNVVSAIAKRLSLLAENGKTGADIHVACTLAAGTGSGAVLDVVAQLQRHLRNEPGHYTLRIHGFVTAKDVGSKNTGNFYANQYAALTELNAFRLGLYEPWDIRANGAVRLSVPKPEEASEGAGKDILDTYKAVSLISETTDGGLDVPLPQQVENLAELIFQESVRQMGDLPKEIRDALTGEDRVQNYPADARRGTRSTAFISFGVQRVAIPEREIREKMSYCFGRQFLLKTLYNTWDDRYRNVPKAFGTDSFVAKRRSIWRVTREHLYLDLVEGATGEPEFKLYETEWRDRMEVVKQRVINENDYESRKGWLKELDRQADKYWKEGFRNRGRDGGVIDYFKIRKEPTEIKARARIIRAFIEKDLLLAIERLEEEYPVEHMSGAIEFLKKKIEEDRVHFDELEQQAKDFAVAADRTRDDIRPEYGKCGRLSKGKQEKLFAQYLAATTQYYYWQTVQFAAQYGHEFCRALLDEIQELHKQLLMFNIRLKLIADNFLVEGEALIPTSKEAVARNEVVYVVDAEYVNTSIRERFEPNKKLQDLQSHSTMEKLRAIRGDRYEFAAYLEEMPVEEETNRVGGKFVNSLRQIAEINAVEAHRQVIDADPQFEGILGQHIIHKLYTDYGGQVGERLEHWLRELIGKSMPMVAFNRNSEPMDYQDVQGPINRMCVFLPKCARHADFEQQLRKKIKSITGGGGCFNSIEMSCKEVPEERNSSEITILSVAFFFPARHTQVVHGLQTRFQERMGQRVALEADRAKFEVFTETHQPPLPDLLKADRKTILKEHLGTVLLAASLGLMQIPEADGEQILFGVVDEFGRITNRVASGMKVRREQREIIAESAQRFGHTIPASTIYLYTRYLEDFLEESLMDLGELVRAKLQGNGSPVDLGALQAGLQILGGHSFLLGGKREDNPMYDLFNTKGREAYTLACQLADKSRL